MAIIKTRRNLVCAYDRRPEDVLVEVDLIGPAGDGIHLRPNSLGYFPIASYPEWVAWAVAIADQMAHPIHVLPLSHSDIFRTRRFEPYREFLQNLTNQEWGEMRQFLIGNCAELMRDGDDPAIRANAVNVLISLKAL